MDGEDEIAGGMGVVNVTFTGEELAQVFNQHFGDFDLGGSRRRIGTCQSAGPGAGNAGRSVSDVRDS